MAPEILGEGQLKAALFVVKHKLLLRKVLMGLLIGVDVIMLGYAITGITSDIWGIPRRRRMDFELVHPQVGWEMFRQQSKPRDLEFGGLTVLTVGDASDVVMRLRNPNAQWEAKFKYVVGLGETVEGPRDGFLLPGEERPLFATIRGGRGAPVFNVTEVRWSRVPRKEIPDFAAYREARINFKVENAQFLPSVVEGRGALSRARFAIINNTAFSYFEPRFIVLLQRGSQLVGIQSVVVEKFRAGERREVEASWFDRIGAVSNIEVVPEIDILNTEVYMRPQ